MIDTHETYVPRTIAKKLANLGFNWECRTYYSRDEQDNTVYHFEEFVTDVQAICRRFQHILAPNVDTAARWLREVKNTYINSTYSTRDNGYLVSAHVVKNIFTRCEDEDDTSEYKVFKTFEDAQIAGITKCVEILEEIERIKRNKIDINKCPQNDAVTFYYPDGTEIVTTNNDVMFNYVRTQIKKNGFTGCYLVTKKGLHNIKIDRYGNLESWPDGVFDVNLKLLNELLDDVEKEPQVKYNQKLHNLVNGFDDFKF